METAFFLASNSGRGFYSLYDEFPGEGLFLHIIKGGPGTGKSGFMRRIAEASRERGMDTELIYCSGDPDSLDGLCIPALNQAWMDGTAPHVREPGLFGVDSDYVNLGRFCRSPIAKEDAKRALEINREYKALYASAYSYLAAESAVAGAFETEPLSGEQLEQVENIISDILEGEARHHRNAKGRQRMRFISAISCRGKYSLEENVKKLCKQYYLFENPLHAHQLLSMVAKQARDYGLETILCPEALRPERLEAVLLPTSEICFRAAEADSCGTGMRICFGKEPEKGERNLHANPIKEKLREQTTVLLARAKSLHDQLEAIYRPYMDFTALNRYTDEYIERLFE